MSEQKTVKQLPNRSEVDAQLTWKLEDIYETDQKWEEEFKKIQSLIPTMKEYKGKLNQSSETLVEALKKNDEISLLMGKLYSYSHMRYDQDTTNSTYQAFDDRAKSLYSEFASVTSYFIPELLSIKEEKLKSFLEENQELQLYKHSLEEILKQKPHVLSAEEEAILAQASEVLSASSSTFGMLNNADLKFPTIEDENGEHVEITHGGYIHLLESSDRRVRKEAFEGVYNTYDSFKNTFASTLSGTVKRDNFNAKVRKYESARQAALSNNNIPESVYDQLVSTVNDHLHLLHRYINIRKKALKLDELHMYDLFTPLVEEIKMEVTYDEAKETLLKALKPLGEEYIEVLKEAYEKRWVDVVENKGKRSGAYSSGAFGTNPYILMNWHNNVNNLFTLAHEFGHSMHSYYTRKTQPYVYGDYSIFVAEVASTCNEAILNDYLLKNTEDPKQRLYLLNHYLEGFRGTVFRQTMFAEFEHTIHQLAQNGEALTPDLLTKTYYELNKKYFGEDIVIDEQIGLEWSRIPHFYYNYYVYQYATGFSAATALSKQILEEGEPAVERYLGYLKSGSSDYPIEVLKKAGVDMTSSQPIVEALKVFEEMLNELEELLF